MIEPADSPPARTLEEQEFNRWLAAELDAACLPGETWLDTLRRTSTPIRSIEEAVA